MKCFLSLSLHPRLRRKLSHNLISLDTKFVSHHSSPQLIQEIQDVSAEVEFMPTNKSFKDRIMTVNKFTFGPPDDIDPSVKPAAALLWERLRTYLCYALTLKFSAHADRIADNEEFSAWLEALTNLVKPVVADQNALTILKMTNASRKELGKVTMSQVQQFEDKLQCLAKMAQALSDDRIKYPMVEKFKVSVSPHHVVVLAKLVGIITAGCRLEQCCAAHKKKTRGSS